MLSVLIADDEWIEREGIRLLLTQSPWEFDIRTAENGEEAMKCLEERSVDLLFTDIKMPFMDGLELLIQANKKYKGMKVVIFSAFADFTYAKTALENSVRHYFLKPIDPDEFQQVLADLVASIMEEREHNRISRYQEIYDEDTVSSFLHGKGSVPASFAALDLPDQYWLSLYDFQKEGEDAIVRFYEESGKRLEGFITCMTIGEGTCLLLMTEDGAQEAEILDFLDYCGIGQACVILGKGKQGIEDLPKLYCTAEKMMQFHFFIDRNQVFHADKSRYNSCNSEQMVERMVQEIYQGIDKDNISYVTETLALLREELRLHMMDSQIYVKYLYSNILRKIFERSRIPYMEFKEYLDQIFAENSLSGLHRMLIRILERDMTEKEAEDPEGQEQKKVIRTVLDIVAVRFQEDISLQSIAGEVYLSPSYLSYLFKKEVGMGLIKYITITRIDRAKELLRSSNMKVSDVAVKAGYQNYSYFNITFKNHTGMSPAQYREHEK